MKLRLVLVVFGIFLALLLAEIIARTKEEPTYTYPNDCFQADPILNHIHTPSQSCRFVTHLWDISYKINSKGLRDIEYSYPKPDGTYRILILGDSFTEGWGVEQEQTYSKQLEKLLADRFQDNKIEVLNAGVASYSPVLEYLYLKEKGLELAPDLVILAFDMTDFLDEKEYTKVTILSDDNLPVSVKPFAPGHLQIYLDNLKNPKFESESGSWYGQAKEFLTKHSSLAKLILSPSPKRLDASPLFRVDEASYSLVKKHLKLIADLLSQNKIHLLLITYPYYDQLKDEKLLSPQVKLAQFASEQNINFLGLTQFFQKDNKAENLYINHDVHFSVEGHKLVALKLASYLIQHYLTE